MEGVISDTGILSDIFTYDMDRQSISLEISLEVREKSGKNQGILFQIFGGNLESLW